MRDVLTALEAEPLDWPAAVTAFTAAADAVRALAAQRQEAATAIEQLATAETERRQAWAAIRAVEQTCRQLVESGRAAERSLAHADAGRRAAQNAYDGHRNERPGLLMSLATRFRRSRLPGRSGGPGARWRSVTRSRSSRWLRCPGAASRR